MYFCAFITHKVVFIYEDCAAEYYKMLLVIELISRNNPKSMKKSHFYFSMSAVYLLLFLNEYNLMNAEMVLVKGFSYLLTLLHEICKVMGLAFSSLGKTTHCALQSKPVLFCCTKFYEYQLVECSSLTVSHFLPSSFCSLPHLTCCSSLPLPSSVITSLSLTHLPLCSLNGVHPSTSLLIFISLFPPALLSFSIFYPLLALFSSMFKPFFI